MYVSADCPGVTAGIELAGGSAFQHELPRLCGLVAAGKIVRVVHLQTGMHRSWFVRERPGGCEPVRVTIYELGRSIGRIFDDIRGGAVYEIWNGNEHRVAGYLSWAADEWLAELLANCALTYTYRAKSGRVIKRDFYPLNVQAEPVPPRREVLVNG